MLSELLLDSLIRTRIRLFVVANLVGLWTLLSLGPALWAERVSQSIEVVARIEPELTLTIEPETGSRIDLGIIHSSPTETRLSDPVRVNVRVGSNLGTPYQVTQQLVDPLTNETGTRLPPETLIMNRNETVNVSRAALSLSSDQPIDVFASDPHGHSETRSVSYQLRVPPGQPTGTYRGALLMTVTAQ